jgi:hypothetical protein
MSAHGVALSWTFPEYFGCAASGDRLIYSRTWLPTWAAACDAATAMLAAITPLSSFVWIDTGNNPFLRRNGRAREDRLDRMTLLAHKMRVVRVGPADGPTISRDCTGGVLQDAPRLTNQFRSLTEMQPGVDSGAPLKTGHSKIKSGHYAPGSGKTGQYRLIKCAINSAMLSCCARCSEWSCRVFRFTSVRYKYYCAVRSTQAQPSHRNCRHKGSEPQSCG